MRVDALPVEDNGRGGAMRFSGRGATGGSAAYSRGSEPVSYWKDVVNGGSSPADYARLGRCAGKSLRDSSVAGLPESEFEAFK